MLLIGSMLHLQHLLFELDMSGSIGKTLDGLLILELATWPWSDLNMALAGSESSTSWAMSCCNRASKSSNMDLISTDVVPSTIQEPASSPSSSEMSMAMENKLSGKSCSWKNKRISYPRLSVNNAKSNRLGD